MPPVRPSAQPEPGSSSTGEPAYLAIGQLRRPHGVKGAMLMAVLTDFPEQLKPGSTFLVGEAHEALTLDTVRPHADGLLVSFRGFDTPEAVGHFRNQYVFIEAAGMPPLPEGEYYHHELIGLEVITDDDQALGALTEIIETGANDVYVVTDAAGREILLPAIPSVILDVEPERRQMRVHLLPGLLGEE